MATDIITDNLALLLQATGNYPNTWGENQNANLTKVERAITNDQAVAITGGTTVLTNEQGENLILEVTGTLVANAIVQVPDRKHLFLVLNNTTGDFKVEIRPGAAGTTVEVKQGTATFVYTQGSTAAIDALIADDRARDPVKANAKTVTDWDTALESGWYQSADTAANKPAITGPFLGVVEAASPTVLRQTIYSTEGDTNADTKVWRRSLNGSTWSAWYKLQWSQTEQDARYLLKGGDAMTGPLAMGGNKVTGVADGTADTDAATYGQARNASALTTGTVPLARLTGTYDISISGNAATATLATTATNANDSALLDGLDSTQFLRSDTGGTLTGGLTVTADSFFNSTLHVGSNGGGDSILQFYDDNSNAWRDIRYDDSRNAFICEHQNGGQYPIACVYDGTSSSLTNYPLGSVILVYVAGSVSSRNGASTVRNSGSGNDYNKTSGAVLSGSWTASGQLQIASSNRYQNFKRRS